MSRESYENPYSSISYHPQTSFESINQLSSSQDFYEEKMATDSDKPRFLSYQEIFNIISSSPCAFRWTEAQTEEQIDDQKEILVRRLTYFQSRISDFFKNKNLK